MDTSITIAAGRIVGIGTPPPIASYVSDLKGRWVSPAMVDMHTHVTFDPHAHHAHTTFLFDEAPVIGAMRAVKNLTEALRNGVCLLRDLGGRQGALEETKRVLHAGLLAPDLVTSGEPICHPGGHGAAFGVEVSSLDDAMEYISSHRAAGHEWVKIMHGPEEWDLAELSSMVSHAHDCHLKVAVHAFTPRAISTAVASAADTVEHAVACDEATVTAARNNGTSFVPTAYCAWLSLRSRFLHTQSDAEAGYLQQWAECLDGSFMRHLEGRLPLLPGTDAGCAPCTFDDYTDELLNLSQWGLDAWSVLAAASCDAAKLLGRDHDFGSISIGKWANLVILEESPVESLRVLKEPVLVLYKGIEVLNKLGMAWT